MLQPNQWLQLELSASKNRTIRTMYYTAIIPSLQTTCYQKFYHPKPPCNRLECSGSTTEWALAAQQKGETAKPFKNNPVYQKPSTKTMQINILLCAIRADHFKRLECLTAKPVLHASGNVDRRCRRSFSCVPRNLNLHFLMAICNFDHILKPRIKTRSGHDPEM